ncbi:hypothetical protein SRABI111_02891 [Pseudomonas carnis]|nr:hypothetical protein SRABI111_02891 [Pseudomonas carnis]CAH0285691.1 hypothetical protein SRABI08_04034 [Pseudomonas carnis]CAH0308808.1 hypothetical protein SRABI110_04968 [Pseudomonas carnis]CAH0315360.1 hypothetical protein SRABI64_04989 [Pseudomonas carnis]
MIKTAVFSVQESSIQTIAAYRPAYTVECYHLTVASSSKLSFAGEARTHSLNNTEKLLNCRHP